MHERNFRFHCDKCGQTFHNKANFKTHMFKQHKIERSNVVIPTNEESVVLAAMAKRLFVQVDEGTKIHCIECKQSYHKRYTILHDFRPLKQSRFDTNYIFQSYFPPQKKGIARMNTSKSTTWMLFIAVGLAELCLTVAIFWQNMSCKTTTSEAFQTLSLLETK